MKHTTIMLSMLIILAVVTACSQHGDLPTEQSYIPAPTPANIAFIDNTNGTYDVSWTVSDDAAVSYYRIYNVGITGQWELWFEIEQSPAGIDLGTGRPIGGFPVGITAVTVENVEGAMAVGYTPDP